MIEKCRMIEFPQKGDDRGHLVIVEGDQDIPFEIKRVFYIYGSDKDVIRGRHANYNTEFVLINVAGTSKVKVEMAPIKRYSVSTGLIQGSIFPEWSGKTCMIFRRTPCFWFLPASITMRKSTSGITGNT